MDGRQRCQGQDTTNCKYRDRYILQLDRKFKVKTSPTVNRLIENDKVNANLSLTVNLWIVDRESQSENITNCKYWGNKKGGQGQNTTNCKHLNRRCFGQTLFCTLYLKINHVFIKNVYLFINKY